MPNIFKTGLFKSPKFSSFPSVFSNKLSARIGKAVPVKMWYLGPGDRVVTDFAHLVRFSPLLSPVMDRFDITFDTHFVPLRLLDPKSAVKDNLFERYLNYFENVDGSYVLPKHPCRLIFRDVLLRCCNTSRSTTLSEPIEQSLYDYTGYAMYDNWRDSIWKNFCQNHLFDSTHINNETSPNKFLIDYLPASTDIIKSFAARADVARFFNSYTIAKILVPTSSEDSGFGSADLSFIDQQQVVSCHCLPVSFLSYIGCVLYSRLGNGNSSVWESLPFFDGTPSKSVWNPGTNFQVYFNDIINWLYSLGAVSDNSNSMIASTVWGSEVSIDWSKVWDFIGISYSDLYLMWKSAVLGIILSSPVDGNTFEPVQEKDSPVIEPDVDGLIDYVYTLPSVRVNALPLLAYWRVICDWYVNLLVDEQDRDADELYLSKVDWLDWDHPERCDWTPINRSWSNDYFTSAFTSPQAGQAVLIPVNGTMQDLRGSNALLKFKERLLFAGKKIKDLLYAVFGIHSSDARLDVTEVIKRFVYPVNIQTITNVAASDSGAPLASLAGNGVGTGVSAAIDYTSEEAGVLLVLASIRPRASYFQGVSRFLTKGDSVYDFVVPDFANVGMQSINNSELYLDYNTIDADGIFGFTRPYAEFMFEPSEVHGSMRDSLLYWHCARHFSNSPVLGQDFMEVDVERDDLNRIFAVQDSQNVVMEVVFDCHVVRPLPKYVRYSY